MYNSLQPANQAEPAVLDAPVVSDASVVQADPVAAEAIALCTRMLAAQVENSCMYFKFEILLIGMYLDAVRRFA